MTTQPNHASKPPVFSVLVACSILAANLLLTFAVAEEHLRIFLVNITYPFWDLLAAGALFAAAKTVAPCSRRLMWAWGSLASALLAAGIGNILWAIFETSQEIVPFPSIADGFYLAYYPLVLVGVLLLPFNRFERMDWWRLGIDISIIMVATTIGLWAFWLGPIAASVSEARIVVWLLSLAYPVGSLILFFALLLLLYRKRQGQRLGPLAPLALSLIVGVVGDMIYGYQSMTGSYQSASWLDLTWLTGTLLYFIAGAWQASNVNGGYLRRRPEITTPQGVGYPTPSRFHTKSASWLTYLPYAWSIGAYVVLIQYYIHNQQTVVWLTGGVGAVTALVLLRQMMALYENRLLIAEVHRQALELRQMNHELQLEVDERKRAEAQLAHNALHDSLTGLPNRALLLDRLHHAIEFAKRHAEYRFSVLFLDLDHFKVVNDNLGHAVGDQLLIAIGQRLQQCLCAGDMVARLGGDEFIVVLEGMGDSEYVNTIVNRIQASLRQPFNLSGRQLLAGASIGIVANGEQYEQAGDILRDADMAMYEAKMQGKARSTRFHVQMRQQAQARLLLEQDLDQALDRGELELHYQPIMALDTNRISGFEALLRWRHPQYGLLAPNEFIPLAEETGAILRIGCWVLDQSCRQLREWQTRFAQTPPLTMSVNISGVQLLAPEFNEQVAEILKRVGIAPSTLRLEVAESAWLNNTDEAVSFFQRLHTMGIQLHIDDFGAGYSSLAYLRYFPVRMLKIDQSFLSNSDDDRNRDIVKALIAMAHDLGMETVAEGVETVEQLNRLRRLGCNFGQGYLLSRPTDKAGIGQLLEAQRSQQTPQNTLKQPGRLCLPQLNEMR